LIGTSDDCVRDDTELESCRFKTVADDVDVGLRRRRPLPRDDPVLLRAASITVSGSAPNDFCFCIARRDARFVTRDADSAATAAVDAAVGAATVGAGVGVGVGAGAGAGAATATAAAASPAACAALTASVLPVRTRCRWCERSLRRDDDDVVPAVVDDVLLR
jgi:hypothetical protein